MKFRPLLLTLPACALIAASCKKDEAASVASKDQPAAEKSVAAAATASATTPAVAVAPATAVAPAAAAAPAAATAAPVIAKPAAAALSADERAAKFGIVKHLPKNTETFLSVYNGSKMADRFKTLKLWALIDEESGGALDNAPDEEKPEKAGDLADKPEENAVSGPGAILGQEVFIAAGKGTSAQLGNVMTLGNRRSYFQMKLLAKALVAYAKKPDGKEEGMAESPFSAMNQELIAELLKDPQSGVGLIEKFELPPVYVGFKTTPATRDTVAQQVAAVVDYMGMAEEMVEPVEFERAGAKFKGYRLLGDKLSKEMAKNRADIEKNLDPESVDRLIATVAKKNLVAASGVLGDYVTIFLGATVEDCQLVAEAKDSLASTDALGFADAYADKDLAAISYTSDSVGKTVVAGASSSSQMLLGLRDGLAGADGLGDTRDVEAMLKIASERGMELSKLSSADTTGMAAYFESGLKIETFGGLDSGSLDWKTPSALGDLGDSADVAFFANFTSDVTYDTRARAYAESIVESAYGIAKKFADTPAENEAMKQFKQGFQIFDTKFKIDAMTLADALRGDLSAGLGNESAIVVDLKGSVPPIPGIPQEVADKGKFIRASVIMPVKDRSKIQASWTKINEATTHILKTVSEMSGNEIPMQKPISSDKAGFTTWFFSMPFFNDDFMPSVTVSDKWFIASTSKTQAIELGTAADKAGKAHSGFVMSVNFDPIRKFGLDWLKVVDENSAKLFAGNDEKLEEFNNTDKAKIKKGLEAMEDFDSISANVRREDNRLRGSIHFKMH